MDYIFSSSILGAGVWSLTISYDVGCQWFTKFWKRVKFHPAAVACLMPISAIRALVPKFHIQSHEEKCQPPFLYNYLKGAGRAEGEGVERNWDWLNPQAPSTAEMTPGHRWDTLNDCFGWLNFRKSMVLGEWLPQTIYAKLTPFCRQPSSKTAPARHTSS